MDVRGQNEEIREDAERNYQYAAESVNYAGFAVRLAAYTIDSVIVWLGLLLVRLVLSGVAALTAGGIFSGNILFDYTLTDIILYLSQVLYFILFTYYTGTTLGKKVMNLRVVSADGDEKLGLWNVVYRETIGRFLCSVTAGIGYFLVIPDKQKKGLHDMLSDTYVIYAKKVKVYPVYYEWSGKINPSPESGQGKEQYSMARPESEQRKGPYSMTRPEPEQRKEQYHLVRPESAPENETEGNKDIEDK